ncbi:four helix bundle protein [Desulfococcaceae bacterium HSG9]|nr:four helix bundle protein [Desulfococcaceae bacterium HSG9]
MPKTFDHEKLIVYQKSIEFIVWLQNILERIPKKYAGYDQIERASTSVPLNIAEGNGKFTQRDRCRYFDIARGSALECAAVLDVFVAKALLEKHEILQGKEILLNIVSMLVGLIRSNSTNRVFEPKVQYGLDQD